MSLRHFRAAHVALACGSDLSFGHGAFHGTLLRADELAHYCAAFLAL